MTSTSVLVNTLLHPSQGAAIGRSRKSVSDDQSAETQD